MREKRTSSALETTISMSRDLRAGYWLDMAIFGCGLGLVFDELAVLLLLLLRVFNKGDLIVRADGTISYFYRVSYLFVFLTPPSLFFVNL